MKYWFLRLEIRNGEYEYNSVSVHQAEQFDCEACAANFYCEAGVKDGDIYYFHGGCVAVKVIRCEEITKKEYETLSRFI